eukprot:TRINITY_DN15786_c0_g1_i1.p4 TRINITY_DN15786_c0_g1~~TRINITY_DN15786_c0_g1_i1.p4  ORF type:complete len:224 (-),score=55.05 TRINITY_DN15786_c0_g1_i1:1172-1843(-)
MMMGFGSVEIALAFWLSIGSAALCVVYGIVNWNNTGAQAGTAKHEEDVQVEGKILGILVYLVGIFYLGYKAWKQTTRSTDYMLAGRQMSPFVLAMSYGATFVSTSAIVGFGGVSGMFGMSMLWLTFLTIFVGVFIAMVVFGKRTRRMGLALNSQTFPELLGRRYHSKFIQQFSGVLIFLFMPIYAAAVLIGICRMLEVAFPMYSAVSTQSTWGRPLRASGRCR